MNDAFRKIGLFVFLLLSSHSVFADASVVVSATSESGFNDVRADATLAGHASATIGGGAPYADGGSFAYLNSAFANTASGSLGASVIANGAGSGSDIAFVQAAASITENLTFDGSGVVFFTFAFNGSFSLTGSNGSVSAHTSVALPPPFPSELSAGFFVPGSFEYFASSPAWKITSAGPNFSARLDVPVQVHANVPVGLEMSLVLNGTIPATGSLQGLFDRTLQVSYFSPDGLTFTSQGGDFLSAVTTAVPEPASASLFIAGLLLTSGLAWRRRSAR